MASRKPEGRIDGRGKSDKLAMNSLENVLCRMSGEMAYTLKRLCVRRANVEVRKQLELAAAHIELAIQYAESEGKSLKRPLKEMLAEITEENKHKLVE